MSSYLGWALLAIVGIVAAGALFVIFGFLAIFLAAPVFALVEDIQAHRPHAAPAPTRIGRPLLRH